MSEFTKGPWVVRGEGIGVVDTSDTQSYGMLNVIARIDKYDFKDQYAANTQLIAAAPDLYEALTVLRKELAAFRCGNDPHLNMADAALAKANG